MQNVAESWGTEGGVAGLRAAGVMGSETLMWGEEADGEWEGGGQVAALLTPRHLPNRRTQLRLESLAENGGVGRSAMDKPDVGVVRCRPTHAAAPAAAGGARRRARRAAPSAVVPRQPPGLHRGQRQRAGVNVRRGGEGSTCATW